MMVRIRFFVSGMFLVAIPIWSIIHLLNLVIEFHVQTRLLDARINQIELEFLLHLTVVATSAALWWTVIVSVRHHNWRSLSSLVGRPSALLTASLILSPHVNQIDVKNIAPSDELPTRSVLSPEVAAGVLAYVLRRRREQINSGFVPDRFTDSEQTILDNIEQRAQGAGIPTEFIADVVTDSDVIEVISAVERPWPTQVNRLSIPDEWSLVVKVFGYPTVENKKGEQAQFRKKRALELLTWLTLNRDRARRSAARTAMWDLNINDSTFSTIVSDMRRGMTEIESAISREDWVPTTYSDELPISDRIVTDDVLLQNALMRFRSNHNDCEEIVHHLSSVRDVPFAGTSYMWADLDGTTTRLVILAITAATEVAIWALATGNMSAFHIAITAGLRVFPGHEELLALQAEAMGKSHNSGFNSVA